MTPPFDQRLSERSDFHDFVEHLDSVAVWSASESGLDYMSPAFEEIYGRPVEDVLDDMSSFLDFLHPDDRDRVVGLFNADEEYFLTEGSLNEELRVVRPNGDIRWVEIRMFPVYSAPDEISEIVGVTIDITDRKRTELELKRQNERLDRFANILSHDLRNPLTTAMGYLELVRDEVSHRYFDAIHRALIRMEEIIDDILTLSRVGKQAETTEFVDLRDCARQAWMIASNGDGRLTTMDDLGEIEADESLVGQLFENAFRNAIEHGSRDVTVEVGLLHEHNGFYIADNGEGVPESEHERIFKAGYSTSEKGTGYGLLIIQEITDAHGWNVRMTNSETGGARLEITNVKTTL